MPTDKFIIQPVKKTGIAPLMQFQIKPAPQSFLSIHLALIIFL